MQWGDGEKNKVNFKLAITKMYTLISWELVADSLGSARTPLETQNYTVSTQLKLGQKPIIVMLYNKMGYEGIGQDKSPASWEILVKSHGTQPN